MFRENALGYFEYLCKSFMHHYPTCMAKTLGAYKVKLRYINQNKTSRFCFFMMENIQLNINDDVCIKYDLKGSKLKRYISNK